MVPLPAPPLQQSHNCSHQSLHGLHTFNLALATQLLAGSPSPSIGALPPLVTVVLRSLGSSFPILLQKATQPRQRSIPLAKSLPRSHRSRILNVLNPHPPTSSPKVGGSFPPSISSCPADSPTRVYCHSKTRTHKVPRRQTYPFPRHAQEHSPPRQLLLQRTRRNQRRIT